MKLKTRFLALLAVIVFAATPAFALDLVTAKADGLVGEMPNGLIGVTTEPSSAEVQNLVKTVNTGRIQIYTQNAKQQNLSVDQIQMIAGEKLQSSTPAGHYIKKNGKWVKK